jgi:hypothetical protein
MKLLLREFVGWMETVHVQSGPCGSPFERPLSPLVLERADFALQLALSSRRPVVMFTRYFSAKGMVAALVLHRAGVKIENVYKGNLDDHDFHRLGSVLARMKTASINFEEGFPRTPYVVREHVAEGKFVFLC